MREIRRAALSVVVASACAKDDARSSDDGGTGPGITITAGATDDGIGEVGDDGIKLDVEGADGTMGGAEGMGDAGCKKVDFLFVIDSSPSMQDEQDNLLTSFPGFIDAIEQTLMIDDFHLMVVDAGPVFGAQCDGTLGAGQRRSANGQECGLSGTQRFADQNQPDLPGTFACIGARGFDGDPNERTMDSTIAALTDLAQPGACNEGFLRDDAVLVVTIITDEEDSPGDVGQNSMPNGECAPVDDDENSTGDPAAWKAAIVAAKGGNEDAVVVLGLLGDCDAAGTCPGIAFDPFDPGAAITGAEPAPRLRMFAQSFGYGSIGPVCAPDYSTFFADAVGVIASACSGFVPPG